MTVLLSQHAQEPRSADAGVRSEWSVCTIRSITAVPVTDGPHSTPKFLPDGVPFLSVNNIVDSRIDWRTLRFISKTDDCVFSRKCKPQRNDILMGKAASVGDVAIVDVDIDFNIWSPLALIRVRAGFNPKFVYFALQSSSVRAQIALLTNASSQGNLGMGDINHLRIALPDPSTQEAIATALSDVDGLIASLDRLIAKKRAIKQAAMQQLLTGKTRLPGFTGEWVPTSLRNLGRTYGGLTGKAGEDFGHGDAQYVPFLNIMNNVVLDPTYLEAVNVAPTERQNEVMQGDLFFNGSSETPEEVGMCAVLLEPLKRVFVNSFCFGFRLFPGAAVDGLYLAYYLRSAEGRRLMYSLAQGATRHNLSKTALLALKFPLPALDEQRAISAVLSEMDSAIEAAARRRDKAKAIKQGMMQALLTGRVRLPVTAAAGGQA